MDAEQVDVVVIGMGPGGEYLAESLLDSGLSVAGVEEGLFGGECPYYGCVPSKMMVRASDLLTEGRRIPGMAGSSQVSADWSQVAQRIRKEATDDWNDKAAADRFVNMGGTLARGHGRISAPGEVTVDSPNGQGHGKPRVFRARRGIVINTGTEPAVPPIEGLAGTPYWTNREAVQAEEVPESLIACGGGAISCELSQVFARFGSRVTVIEGMSRLLPLDEPEAGDLLRKVFTEDGIDVRTGARPDRVHYDGSRFSVEVGGQRVSASQLLIATGRRNNLARLGLGVVGVDENARTLEVDDRMRAAKGVWAIGDITGHGGFTHMSMYQGEIARRDILGEPGPGAVYRAVPHVTFTDPEIGGVGLTEAQARDQGLAVRTGITQIPASARGWIHKAGNDGFIKVIEDSERKVLIGATSAGPVGGEVLSALVVAVHAEVPIATLRNMIYAYPTFHRAIENALKDLDSNN
ncbi:MAG TPA: NAD(P)/FAD-dependent oxidoreductase [Streptosporangiaceae bacterium]|nr:NAD(P)/FAD-dependent oxidoreductase [Streptosporangiaceae bacterium]